MPKLFIDVSGPDNTQYEFMDAAGNKQFTSTSSVDLIDGTTSTDIYQYEHVGSISQGHLVATIKWPANTFRDPTLVLHPDVDSGDTGRTTKLPLSTNHIRQSLNLVTKGRSRAHWRRIPQTDKLALFAGHTREKRLIADECHRAGKRWLQIEGKPVHHCSITDVEIVASWIAVNRTSCQSKGLFSFALPRCFSKCFSLSNHS
ncbi:unnamed protein product [Rhizoctonia solani]|uniref:Uncharacterized protein n=1 Tax=Rhizoctonia solani TaxID=456999 RepID=A0A8H3GHQ4_9AGAM|nr:unnamed protein product [Rhizoctonia solani]